MYVVGGESGTEALKVLSLEGRWESARDSVAMTVRRRRRKKRRRINRGVMRRCAPAIFWRKRTQEEFVWRRGRGGGEKRGNLLTAITEVREYNVVNSTFSRAKFRPSFYLLLSFSFHLSLFSRLPQVKQSSCTIQLIPTRHIRDVTLMPRRTEVVFLTH